MHHQCNKNLSAPAIEVVLNLTPLYLMVNNVTKRQDVELYGTYNSGGSLLTLGLKIYIPQHEMRKNHVI